jgi:metal-sulfur cluster biosynthetic enzyme
MLTELDILEALRACFDTQNPFHQPLNIVDLGLVESITLALDPDAPGAGIPGVPPRQSLVLTLIPSTPDEDASTILLAQIQNRLAGIPELSRISVRFLDKPTWSQSRITPEGRRLLKLEPPAFPILNNR